MAEGPEAIAVVRAMLGPTNGRQAPAGTIRGDFGLSRQMNLVHASDGPDAARREIEIYFAPSELMSSQADDRSVAGAPRRAVIWKGEAPAELRPMPK